MDYKKELRKNRKAFLQLIEGGNPEITKDERKLAGRKVISIQNTTRGKLGELLGDVFLTSNKKVEREDILNDSAIFKTPFGKRRIDVYWTKEQLAIEAKMGYVYATKSIRNQIEKDAFLLNNSFKKVVWLLIKGGSKNVKSELTKNGIEIIEGWPL